VAVGGEGVMLDNNAIYVVTAQKEIPKRTTIGKKYGVRLCDNMDHANSMTHVHYKSDSGVGGCTSFDTFIWEDREAYMELMTMREMQKSYVMKGVNCNAHKNRR
jgi:hypothetical protein